MSHHTKDKGDLAVLIAQVDLNRKGYTVLIPLTEHSPFDLVAYKDGKFERVQVKYRSSTNGEVIQVPFSSRWASKTGNHIVPIDKNEVDLYCVYCPDTEKCYYLRPKDFGATVHIRLAPTKNGISKGVHMASEYERIK